MNIDIHTLIILISITNLLQVTVLFFQFFLNKVYRGIGWWLMGFSSSAIGYGLLFLRDIISIKLITIIIANALVLSAFILIYIGVTRFLGRKENRMIIFSVSAVFISFFIYYTFINNNITMRTVVIYSAVAIFSLLTARSLLINKTKSFAASAYFNSALCFAYGLFFIFRAVVTISVDPVNGLFTPTIMQTISFLVLFIYGILLTFGLIIMVNQRLNSDNREDKENLERVFNTTPDAVLVTRLNDGLIVNLNDGFLNLTGYTSAEVLGKTVFDMDIWYNPADRQKFVGLLSEKGFCENIEYIFKRKDFSKFIGILSAKIITLQDSPHIITVTHDITGRKQVEDALRQSSQKLEAIISASPDGIGMVSLDGKLQLMSDKLASMYGYTLEQKDELLGKVIFDFIDPSNHELLMDHIHNLIDGRGKNRVDHRIVEYLAVKKDNSRFYVEIKYAVLSDSNGNPTNILFVERDITERKLAEEALRESEEKLNTLFSSMTEMVVLHELVFDKNDEAVNYRITDCNNAFTVITGIQKDDAVGKLATEIYQTEAAPFIGDYARVALSGIPYEYTTYYEPMDKYFSVSAVSTKKNTFATITADITGIREIQNEIIAKNEELEDYLYIASHDLRSPLVNIQGFSRRLQKHTDLIKEIISDPSLPPGIKSDLDHIIDEDIPKSLKFIFASVTKMDTLLAGLLHLSRTGRTMMIIKKIEANQLFHGIIGNYNFQLTELNAVVNISKLPPCYGDENLLNQLFSNIIGNAIKYRDRDRQLSLEITAHIEFRKVIYSISDNGMGIDQRHLEKIWDIFYKVDASEPDAGDGLGLSIVKRIAEKHNGRVRVESERGKGSVFFVELQRNEFSV